MDNETALSKISEISEQENLKPYPILGSCQENHFPKLVKGFNNHLNNGGFHFEQQARPLKSAIDALCDFDINPSGVGKIDVNEYGFGIAVIDSKNTRRHVWLSHVTLFNFRCDEPLVGKLVDLTEIHDILVDADDDDTVFVVHRDGSNHISFTFGEEFGYIQIPKEDDGHLELLDDDNEPDDSAPYFYLNGYEGDEMTDLIGFYVMSVLANFTNGNVVPDEPLVEIPPPPVAFANPFNAPIRQGYCDVIRGPIKQRTTACLQDYDTWESFAKDMQWVASQFDKQDYTALGATPSDCWPGHESIYYAVVNGTETVVDWLELTWSEAQQTLSKAVYIGLPPCLP